MKESVSNQIHIIMKILFIIYILCLLFCFVFGLLNVTETILEIKTIIPNIIWENIKNTNEIILNDIQGIDNYVQKIIVITKSGTLLFIDNFSMFALVILIAKIINYQFLQTSDNNEDYSPNGSNDNDEDNDTRNFHFDHTLRQRLESVDTNSLIHPSQLNCPMPKLENEMPNIISEFNSVNDILVYDEDFGVLPSHLSLKWKARDHNQTKETSVMQDGVKKKVASHPVRYSNLPKE